MQMADVRQRPCSNSVVKIETDFTVTAGDKHISHCWGRHCKADILISLVSVIEKEDINGRGVRCQQFFECDTLFRDALATASHSFVSGKRSTCCHDEKPAITFY